jgi:hypothetical protein
MSLNMSNFVASVTMERDPPIVNFLHPFEILPYQFDLIHETFPKVHLYLDPCLSLVSFGLPPKLTTNIFPQQIFD